MFAPLLIALLVGNTWYVDVNATPPGNGTPASPYSSIQYALDQVATVHGDTLLVAPGTYLEKLNFAKRVLVVSTAGPAATQLRPTMYGFGVWSTAGYVSGPRPWRATLRGFTIHGGAIPNSKGVGAGPELAFLVLERCVVTGFTQGIGVYQTGHAMIYLNQCTIAGNYYGIFALGGIAGWVESWGCVVSDNSVDVSGYTATTFYTCCVPPYSLPYGQGNFPTPPGFWNGPGGDFRLKPLSPCIDTGHPVALPPDPDGSLPDVGAFAYDALYAPHPASYCTPKVTSLGCAVLITSTGSASVSGPDDFRLRASPALNNKLGLFLWSSAPKATPFAGATLCLKSPLVRGTPLSSGGSPSGNDCTGVFQWHFSQAYMASKGILAGSILYAQAWGRDNGFAPPNNAQLSDARVFPVGP